MQPNPFTERGRITDPQHFVGRWRELSVIFERLEARRPLLIAGPLGVGKSSLLTHIAQSAAANLERDDLETLFVDLAVLPDAAAFYRLVTQALGVAGESVAALELALIEGGEPVLLALDNADQAIAAGWGEQVLEALARASRRGSPAGAATGELFVVAAVSGSPPNLSEPFSVVTLGAIADTEVRLLAEAYLDDTEVSFSPAELRELTVLSGGHPGYLQRAAFQLYQQKVGQQSDWRAAFRQEVRDQPVLGAPLPPGTFEGETGERLALTDETTDEWRVASQPQAPRLSGTEGLFAALLPLVAAVVALLVSRNWLVTLGVFVMAVALVVVMRYGNRQRN